MTYWIIRYKNSKRAYEDRLYTSRAMAELNLFGILQEAPNNWINVKDLSLAKVSINIIKKVAWKNLKPPQF